MTHKILVVDDEESIRFTFSAFLTDAGYTVDTAENLEEALARVAASPYAAIFLDILLGRDSGMQVLQVCREKQPSTPIIMVTGAPEVKTAAEAVRLGAFDYIPKPVHQDELLRQAKIAVDHKALVDLQEAYRLRMAAVFQSICEGVVIFDEDMKLLEMNSAAAKILGCDAQLTGLNPEELGDCCPALKLLQETIEQRCEGELFRLETTDGAGQPLVLGLTMAPLTGQGERELGTVLVLRDERLPVRQVEM
jgi:two-component system response regulator HydG